MDDSESALLQHDEFRRPRGMWRLESKNLGARVASVMVWPLFFAAGCWLILFFPTEIAKVLPLRPWEGGAASPPGYAPAPSPPLPPKKKDLSPEEKQLVPQDLLSCWAVGEIAGQLKSTCLNETEELALLQQVAAILNVPFDSLSRDKVLNIGELIDISEHTWTRDTVAWLLGALTLVNILWTLGICGIACSIGPVLYCCLQPVLELTYYYVLIPVYVLLSRVQILYEPFAYLACLYIIALAQCFGPGPRDWVVVTGLALSMAAFSHWGRSLWGPAVNLAEDQELEGRLWAHLELLITTLACFYIMLGAIPMAVLFESSFLGWIACGTFYGTLAFYLLPLLCNRFDIKASEHGKEDLSNVLGPQLLASLLVCTLYIAVKVLRLAVPNHAAVAVLFLAGLTTFGPISLFSWGLVISSRGRLIGGGNYVNQHYYISNTLYLVLAASTIMLGSFNGLEGVTNLGISFAVLWLAAKTYDAVEAVVKEALVYAVILYTSILLWLLALFFNSHPNWLIAIFQ